MAGRFPDIQESVINKQTRGYQLLEVVSPLGIPSLIILDENRKVITPNGRSAIAADPNGEVSFTLTVV